MAIKSKIRPNRQTENTPHQKMSPVSEKHPEKWIHSGKYVKILFLIEESQPYQTATPYLQMCAVSYSKQMQSYNTD